MKTDRKPVYSDDRQTRVRSSHNGLWEYQRLDLAKDDSSNKHDPWVTIGRPTDFDIAYSRLNIKAITGGKQ